MPGKSTPLEAHLQAVHNRISDITTRVNNAGNKGVGGTGGGGTPQKFSNTSIAASRFGAQGQNMFNKSPQQKQLSATQHQSFGGGIRAPVNKQQRRLMVNQQQQAFRQSGVGGRQIQQAGGIRQSYGGQQRYGGAMGDASLTWVEQEQAKGPAPQQNQHMSQDFSLFNERIMYQVLANKHLIPKDVKLGTENQQNFIRIGKNFMLNVSRIRNIALPPISQADYETLGRIVSKVYVGKLSGANSVNMKNSTKQLFNTTKGILSSSKLTSSLIRDGSTIPKSSTTKQTTGMLGDKSNALMDRSGRDGPGRGMTGMIGQYSNSYKPVDDRIKPTPYDSIWSIE